MTGCSHGMPSPAACVDCMDEGNLPTPPRPAPPHIVSTFRARYEGHCAGCNLPIGPGQLVHRLSNSVTRHEGCE